MLVALFPEPCSEATTTGVTPVVKDDGQVTANDAVIVPWPATILNGIPSMTLVLSCAAVSVLPAVNVNLPDIYRPFQS